MQLTDCMIEERGVKGYPSVTEIKSSIDTAIESTFPTIRTVNSTIYENPQLAWEETIAHDVFAKELTSIGFDVTPSAYGIKTAFEVISHGRSGGRTINFNAEYDALPDIGHACGHNLISTAGLTAFLALSALVKKYSVPGIVQLLGTPAEEADGGKLALLDAGAFKNASVSLMGHPTSTLHHGPDPRCTGSAGQRSLADLTLTVTFHGVNAHAAARPWDGVNALDAVVCAYNNISCLRQQMRPDERVHGCILESPKVPNVIPGFTKVLYSVRASTLAGCRALTDKVRDCFSAAALATGCRLEMEEGSLYADVRVNSALCAQYTQAMARFGEQVVAENPEGMGGSTDQGNVTYAVPSLHVMFGVPNVDAPDVFPHNAEFTRCAGTEEALRAAVRCGKGLAMVGWEILTNDAVWEDCKADFEKDKKSRRK